MNTIKITSRFFSVFTLTFLAAVSAPGLVLSQSAVYDNFEGAKMVHYREKFGVLDTNAKNPAAKDVNTSQRCALYVRNGSKKFDNIKMALHGSLSDVDKYATYLGVPPRIKMKIYTSAPPGTLVEILLGSRRGNNDYPAGTHSQYQAYTKVSNQWEELEFLFSQIPQGSETSASQIDQVTLLFNPNSANSDTYYFDDLTGPPLVPASQATTAAGGSQEPATGQQNTAPQPAGGEQPAGEQAGDKAAADQSKSPKPEKKKSKKKP